MQSLRSKIIIWAIRNRHLFRFKLKPEVVDENFSVKDFRHNIDKISNKVNKIPEEINVESVEIKGMYGEWIKPLNNDDKKVLMYIHGGGFISGSCLTHRMHVIKFVKGSGIKALLFDYRLAPEHPYPAPLDDCVNVYNWLLSKGYKAANIIIAGESAGGTLALSTVLKIRDCKIELPKSVVSISPVTDLTCQANSFKVNSKKDIAPMGSWNIWTQYYIGENDPRDKYLSPQMSDLSGLPPIMIQVGTHEIHLDDATSFASKAKNSGVDVTLHVWDKMIHAFPILSPMFPEAKAAMKEICDYINK